MRLPFRSAGFPYIAPTWPGGVERPPLEKKTGIDYDTAWARKYPARLARAVIVDDVMRPVVKLLASPTVIGADRIEDLDAPVIFAPNHASHVDTPLMLTTIPDHLRHRTAVVAGADYFFDNRVKGAVSALAMGAVPMERLKVSRRSSDNAAELIEEGWNILIFPEGGRTPDGWGHPFRGGAAYIAIRTGAPVVPVHIEGTGRILPKGAKRPKPGKVDVTFGAPLQPNEGEDARRFAARIGRAVAVLADEQSSDWWAARRRAASGETPPLTGPDAGAWRRAWLVEERRRRHHPKPPWPRF